MAEFHTWLWNYKPKTRRLCYHPANESSKNPMQDMGKGIVSGVPDYVIDIPNDEHIGLRLEFKLKGKKQSDNQIEAMNLLREMDYRYEVVYSCIEAKSVLLEYIGKSKHKERFGF